MKLNLKSLKKIKYFMIKKECKSLIFIIIIFYIMESNNNTNLNSWIKYEKDTQFPIQNIPFSVCFLIKQNTTRCCTRIGDFVIDLHSLERDGLLNSCHYKYSHDNPIFGGETLNKFIEQGRETWKDVRKSLQKIFVSDSEFNNSESILSALHKIEDVENRMPVFVQDYTDFYSSKNHAFNMGAILRGPDNALQPNWVHLPVGYHGRASTIVVDRTKIRRPRGQIKPPNSEVPIFSECKRLDYEVEIGVVIGKSNKMGQPVKVKEAEEYIFGLVLLNDWSARDIQAWEYQPLGPFNAKNFATTISPWIVTLEALEPFKVELPKQDPTPLKYLHENINRSYNIPIDVQMKTKSQNSLNKISESNYKYMYWTANQQIAHHTVTGCKLNVGDILGSGTISGTEQNTYGSIFELNNGGKAKVKVGDEERLWIEDGDYVNFNAVVQGDGFSIGFGPCGGEIIPALNEEEYY